MMNANVARPATLRSKVPADTRLAHIPAIAQAAINAMLTKSAAALMNYYMSETDGFAPAAHTIYMYTGLKQPHMITYRKELIDKGFITFNKSRNEIIINWPHIIELGKVALMLADNEDCNVKETMHGGKADPISRRKIGELMKEYWDEDARDDVSDYTHPDYIKANGKKIERMTELEYQRWLMTGCSELTDLPVDPDYVEPHDLPEVESVQPEPVEYLNVPHDQIEDYPMEGEFFIQGLTKEEYDSWVAAGIPFIDPADAVPAK